MVRRQFPGLRERQDAKAGPRFHHPASREVQEADKVANMNRLALPFAVIAILCAPSAASAADAGFTQFIASLWPEAQAAGVSRATFDAQTGGLEPDYKLPDQILPGRPAT